MGKNKYIIQNTVCPKISLAYDLFCGVDAHTSNTRQNKLVSSICVRGRHCGIPFTLLTKRSNSMFPNF